LLALSKRSRSQPNYVQALISYSKILFCALTLAFLEAKKMKQLARCSFIFEICHGMNGKYQMKHTCASVFDLEKCTETS